jgi:hypothetical protein
MNYSYRKSNFSSTSKTESLSFCAAEAEEMKKRQGMITFIFTFRIRQSNTKKVTRK